MVSAVRLYLILSEADRSARRAADCVLLGSASGSESRRISTDEHDPLRRGPLGSHCRLAIS